MRSRPDEPVVPRQIIHPQRRPDGGIVVIRQPSASSASASWNDPSCVASVLPGGNLPSSLNGIPFQAWEHCPTSANAWNELAQAALIDEPAFSPPEGLAPAAGVVIQEVDGRIWLVCPTNQFGGYEITFPKGRQERGVSLQATALIEAFEESGLHVRLVRHLVDVARTETYARYYLAERVGGAPSAMGWESQCVKLVPEDELKLLGAKRLDQTVTRALLVRGHLGQLLG